MTYRARCLDRRTTHRGKLKPQPSRITIQQVSEAIREAWPQTSRPEVKRPWWAQLSLERGWMTQHAFLAVPPEPTGRIRPGIYDIFYEQSPLLGLVPKKRFSEQVTSGWKGGAR